jgi:hypothetical protein
MRLKSSLDLLSRSEGNVPVAIFSLGEQRKFLHVSELYEVSLLIYEVVLSLYVLLFLGHTQTSC